MKSLSQYITLALAAMLSVPAVANAQSPAPQLIAPTEKNIEEVVKKSVDKNTEANESERRKASVNKSIKMYLASPSVATEYTSETTREASDSLKSLKALISAARKSLSELDDQLAKANESLAASNKLLTDRRDSLKKELALITARTKAVDSLSADYRRRMDELNNGITEMNTEMASLEKSVKRASDIKDAATAKRSQVASFIDQIATIETQSLRQPLNSDFKPRLAEAEKLLDTNRPLFSSYGTPQQLAQAEKSINHIKILDEYSALIAEANKTMVSKFDAEAVKSITMRLDSFYKAHALDNRAHIETVKTTLHLLKQYPEYYARLSTVCKEIKEHTDGWLFAGGNDVPAFNAIIDMAGSIPESFPLLVKAKDALIKNLRDSGKNVVEGEELYRIVDNIQKQF